MTTYFSDQFNLRCLAMFGLSHSQAERLDEPGEECGIPRILAAVAYECFVNEVHHALGFLTRSESENPTLATARDALDELEESRASVKTKTQVLHLILTGRRLARGEGPYPDLAFLFRLRDALVHSKAAIWNPGDPTKLTNSALVEGLRSRKLIPAAEPYQGGIWTERTLVPQVARWAHNVSLDRALWLSQLFPEDSSIRASFGEILPLLGFFPGETTDAA